jgi:hypothetical protein
MDAPSPSEKPQTGDRKLEKDAEGGGAILHVVEKSSKATLHAPSLIRRPLNPGGSNTTTEITLK